VVFPGVGMYISWLITKVSINITKGKESMDARRIGLLEVSIVGLGCNNFGRRLDSGATSAVVDAALDAGINFFDTADVYGAPRVKSI
jgi:hypothetical protein